MDMVLGRRQALLLSLSGLLAACGPKVPDSAAPPVGPQVAPEVLAMYAAVEDNGFQIPAVPPRYLIDENIRREVTVRITEAPGSMVIDPWQRYLYFLLPGDRAIRYRVAVGDQGRSFSGAAVAQFARDWPGWRPTDNMIREFPDMYGPYRNGLPGGLQNPLGARAIYLYRGGRDTMYRIHGTNEVASIGHATSAGCIRLYNQDAIHLASIFTPGAKVIVLTQAQSAQGFGEYTPTTTPYSGASFTAPAQVAEVPDYSDPGYVPAYPGGFPESPYN
ncbi:L,D-transpeptidase [Pseudogemmobacter humi]|uniref:Putative L,D-transpeptidase ErfK/SrfK n=1 Tax=Pseudogemmobacter humi TaxID=2483812 RepID=A0A3P5XJ97_9RHOB|nr:L,D-transpeptidase [Pseudogemmobacter humi]VDC30231.1 putative L,D-transpeptidase ErfK/SrfK precursor [Pseudogemmobacter humi]